MRPERPHVQCVVRFFPDRVYIDLNHYDTFGYEWPLARCCHLIVCFDGWFRGWLCHYCITLIMMLIILLMLVSSHVISL
jgi:hypothetical protein